MRNELTQIPEPQSVRRHADRSALSFDHHAQVYRDLGGRLLEHLDPIRIDPALVLDLGCGTGALGRDLCRRYPKSRVVGVDLSSARLRVSLAAGPRWFSRQNHVCADAARLPFADNSVDLVCANLLLPWIGDPRMVFRECARVLSHGGLIMLSSLGPDSLRELRALLPAQPTRLHPLADMHDSADALVASGFTDVVADSELLRANYHGPSDLIRELRATGSTNALSSRPRHLAAGKELTELRTKIAPDPFTVSFEAIYLHAWYLDRRSVEVALPSLRQRPRPSPGSE